MTGVTVIVAPEPRFDVLRATLQDWVSAGVIGPFLWSHSGDPSGVLVRCGWATTDAVRLDRLAATEQVDRVVLVDLTAPDRPIDVGLRFASAVEQVVGPNRVLRIRAVFTGTAEQEQSSTLAVPGWHTVLMAPEDGRAPDRPGAAIATLAAEPAAIAATLCGVAGLWSGQDGSPLQDEIVPVSADFRLARAYHRAIDSDALESRLRGALLRVDGRLPLPVVAGIPALAVDDPALAASTMAASIWARNNDLLRGPREAVQPAAASRIGAARAISLFFRFLAAAVRNAPGRWLSGTLDRVRASTARAVQEAIYGPGESAFEVVVGGVTSDGRRAGWGDHRDAVGRIAQVLESGSGEEHHSPVDAGRLWSDYAAAALTLADAGDRTPGLVPMLLNGRRGIVAAPADIVPNDAERFRQAPPALVAAIGEAEVDAFDLLRARDLDDLLAGAEQDPATARLASDCRNDLVEWMELHRGGFAVQVGRAIAGAFVSTRSEISEVLQRLRGAASTQDDVDRLGPQQRRLARRLRWLAGICAGLLALIVVLGISAVLGVWPAIGWAAAAVLAWLLSSFGVFVRGQQELFQIMNVRTAAEGQLAVDERNLRQAVRDLRRIGDLYQQFLLWSRALGVVLDRPFGAAAVAQAPSPVLTGLPLAVMVGRLVPDESEVERVSADLRRELYVGGWLGSVWDAVLGAAPALLGARAGELGGRPESLYADVGASGGLLDLWVGALVRAGVPATSGAEYWRRALTALSNPDHAEALGRLRQRVTVGADDSVPLKDFETGVVVDDVPDTVAFNPALLTASAVLDDRNRVVGARFVSAVEHGLGGAWTLVQFSGPVPEQEFSAFGEPDNGEDPHDGIHWVIPPVDGPI